jgi:hypothetical protein
MTRVLIAGVVGGLIVFVWSAVAHMALPIGTMGLKVLPNEAPVLAALSSAVPEAGLYFFPGMDMSGKMTDEQTAAWTQKYRTGPAGILVYKPQGGEPLAPTMFVTELLSTVFAAVVAAWVISITSASYGARVAAVCLMGLFGWLSLSVSYWNWYGFPTSYIAGEAIDQIVGWLLGGLAIAKLAVPKGK